MLKKEITFFLEFSVVPFWQTPSMPFFQQWYLLNVQQHVVQKPSVRYKMKAFFPLSSVVSREVLLCMSQGSVIWSDRSQTSRSGWKRFKKWKKRKIVMSYLKNGKKKKTSFILLKNFWNIPSSLMTGIKAEVIYFIWSVTKKRHFLVPEFWILNSMPERTESCSAGFSERLENKVLVVSQNSSPHKHFRQFITCKGDI